MNDPPTSIRAKQFRPLMMAMGRRTAFLFCLACILTCISCAPAGPPISLMKIIWEEIDVKKTPTQEDYPDANAIFLMDKGEFSVTKHWIFTRHVIIKIMNEAGLKYANVEIPFHSGAEIHNIKGRTIRKDNTIVELQPEDIHEKTLFPQYVLYADSKAKIFAMPGAEVGSIIEYSYSILHKTLFLSAWEFQRSEPILLSTITLNVPAFLRYKYMLATRKQVEVEKSISHPAGRVKAEFKVRNAPAITYEPFMPSLSEVTTRIYFSLSSLSVLGIDLPMEGDSWEILGHNYWLRVKDKMKANKGIQSQVQEITTGSTVEIEKIADIYDFIQSKIRYVAIEIEEGRVIPHKPSEVLNSKYGDCKDKVFLFIAMLQEMGIDALPVLTRTSISGEVIENFISAQQFNHMVIAVPARYFTDMEGYEKVVIEGDKEYTVRDDYILLDATSRAIPFGQIPGYLENTKALLIREEGSKLMTIPSSSANANKTLRVCDVDIHENGTFLCSVRSTKTGQEASRVRSFLQPLGKAEQKEWFENILSRLCPGAILEEHSISELFETAMPLILNYKFRIPQYAQKMGTLLTFSPGVLRSSMVDRLTRETREHAINFDYCQVLIDIINIEIPEGFDIKTIPGALSKSSTFGDYSLTCYRDREKVVLNKQFMIKKTMIPKADYEEVKSLFESILISERKNVTLCRNRKP